MAGGMRDRRMELYYDLTELIIRGFWMVVKELGPGLAEAVYKRVLPIALVELGLSSKSEVPYAVYFRGHNVGNYRADHVVEDKVIVESKSILQIRPSDEEQILNYMSISKLQVGLILNFGPKPTIQRYALTK